MVTKKVTKNERYEMLIAYIEASETQTFELVEGEKTLRVSKEEMIEALRHEQELLTRKNANGEKKLTPQQESNADLKEQLYNAIAVNGRQTISQLIPQLTSDAEITHGRIVSLLTQLRNENRVEREKKGKETYYFASEG